MATARRWGPLWLAVLCLLLPARGQGDFDLADALDDPGEWPRFAGGWAPAARGLAASPSAWRLGTWAGGASDSASGP